MLATSRPEEIDAAKGRRARVRAGETPPGAPVPGPGQIVVQRRFWAMNSLHLARISAATGQPSPNEAARLAAVGAAGTVIATGEGVTRFAVGDEVFGQLQAGPGAARPYVLADAGGPHIELRPEDLEPAAAAALVEPGLTAKTIARAAGVQPGQRALVVGATGAVGMALVPLLAEAGASVVAIAAPGDEGCLLSLGVAVTIDDDACDAIEALGRYPDVDFLVDLVSFSQPYLQITSAVPSCGALVGPAPDRESDDALAGRPGLPHIEVCAEPGDLLDLTRRAPGQIPAVLRAPTPGHDAAGSDWIAVAA